MAASVARIHTDEAASAQPRSAATARYWGYWGGPASLDRNNEFYTTFKYTHLKGLEPEKGVCRRDPSTIIKVGDLYYVWYTKYSGPKPVRPRNAEQVSDIPPAGGAYIPDKFDDPEDGQGFTWGLCHYGASDWNFLLRFECDLHRDSRKQLAWKHFRHYSTVRDVMADPARFGVPAEALRGKR